MFVAFAVEEIPPFIMAGTRFIIASFIIFCILLVTKGYKGTSKAQIKNSIFAGILFLAMGNGGMSFALQYIDSNVCALLTAGQPLILLFMLWFVDKKAMPWKSWIGVMLGITGMFLLVSQRVLISTADQWLGVGIIMFCLLSWGAGSIFVNRTSQPKSYLLNAGIQMLTGGVLLVLISFLVNEPQINWMALRPISYWSMGVLAVFGSVVAFTAFNFLLMHVSPEKVSTATYINPIVAMILGFSFRNELVTSQSVFAAAILLAGVYFINVSKPKTAAH